MASSSKKPYNRSYSPDNTTDSSTDVALPLQYDTEEDLIQVFKSLRDELESRTELKWEQTGKGKGVKKEDLLQIVLEKFFDEIVPNIMNNCSIGGVPYKDFKESEKENAATKGESKVEPFSNELHERVVKYQDILFNTRAENVNKRKELPVQSVDALKVVFEEDLTRLERLENERLEFTEKKPRALPRRSIGGTVAGKPNPVQVEQDFNFGKSTIDYLIVKVPLLSTAAEQATQVTKDAALVD